MIVHVDMEHLGSVPRVPLEVHIIQPPFGDSGVGVARVLEHRRVNVPLGLRVLVIADDHPEVDHPPLLLLVVGVVAALVALGIIVIGRVLVLLLVLHLLLHLVVQAGSRHLACGGGLGVLRQRHPRRLDHGSGGFGTPRQRGDDGGDQVALGDLHGQVELQCLRHQHEVGGIGPDEARHGRAWR